VTERVLLVKAKAPTGPHGRPPNERSIADHLRLGIVNLDKPSGPTSHQVVAWMKAALAISRAGHGGTLDPNVTGVLPVALTDATRALKALLLAPKEYVCVLRLHADAPPKRLETVLREFVGDVYQVPPLKSAVKRQLRVRRVYTLDLLENEGREVLFRVRCQAGTYVRKLCSDVGTVLGTGANMADLRRTRTAGFGEDTIATLHDLTDAVALWKETGDESALRRVVQPMERMIEHLPRVIVRDSAVDALCHGADLAAQGVLEVERGLRKGQAMAVFTQKGEGVALGTALASAEEMLAAESGLVVNVDRVLMDKGTYPRAW